MNKALAVFLVLFCMTLSYPNADEKQERAKLKTLETDIKALQRRLEKQAKERSSYSKNLEKYERVLASIGHKISRLDNDILDLNNTLTELLSEQNSLEQQRLSQQHLIAREMNAIYQLGTAEPIKFLLNQEDPDKLNRALKYYRYFVDARSKKINHYRSTLAQINAVKSTIKANQTTLLSTRATMADNKTAMANAQAERSKVLTIMDKELGNKKSRLAKMHEQRKQLETLLMQLETSIQNLISPTNTTPFVKRRGKIPWPIKGKVLQAYGSLRAKNLPWKGWLIATKEGAPVHAVHNGRVVFSDYLRGYGLVLIVDHGNRYLSLYAHNQTLLKETGDWIHSGEKISLAGISGGLTKSALYFEIRYNGQPLDPKPWLGKR